MQHVHVSMSTNRLDAMDEPKKSLTVLIEDFTGDDEWGVQIGPSFPQKAASMQQPIVLILPAQSPNVTYKKTQPICYPTRVSSSHGNNNIYIPRHNANRLCSPPPTKRVQHYQLTGPAPSYNHVNDYAYINDGDNDDDDALLQQALELSLRGDGDGSNLPATHTTEKTRRYDADNINTPPISTLWSIPC